MNGDPIRAWTLPSAQVERTRALAAALARTLAAENAGAPTNRAYRRCRRWHKRWRSDMYIANGKPCLDCSRCGMRWIW